MEKGQQEDQLFNNAEVLGIQEKSMDNKKKSHELAAKMFDDALDSMTKGGNKDNSIEKLVENFEEYSQNEDGIEFWYARDLQKLFDYDEWRNFQRVIEKAKQACSTSGNEISHHFVDVNKVIEVGKGAQMEVSDIQMTRYACYLAAQNGDSRKKTVAFAQTYFAIQTRKQEIRDEDEASIPPISEDKKRLLLRNEIKEHNKRLASAAKSAGVEKPIDYAVFQNFGYKGLYGGLDSHHGGLPLLNTNTMPNQITATPVAYPKFPAAITSEQIDTIEKVLKEHNRTRRLMLLFLSFDSETFIEKAKAIMDGDEDIYMEAIEALDDYQKKLKLLSELANSALARFLWVGEYLSQKGDSHE